MATKKQLLDLAERIATTANAKMAIGGGVAVCAHGYRRDTADVDAFFHYEDQKKILRAVNLLLGDDFILEELDPSHWTVTAADSPPPPTSASTSCSPQEIPKRAPSRCPS